MVKCRMRQRRLSESVGDVYSPDNVKYSSRRISTDELCVTMRGDRFKYSFLSPGIVTSVCPRSPQEKQNFRRSG